MVARQSTETHQFILGKSGEFPEAARVYDNSSERDEGYVRTLICNLDLVLLPTSLSDFGRQRECLIFVCRFRGLIFRDELERSVFCCDTWRIGRSVSGIAIGYRLLRKVRLRASRRGTTARRIRQKGLCLLSRAWDRSVSAFACAFDCFRSLRHRSQASSLGPNFACVFE